MRFLLSKIQEEKEDRMRKETDLEEVKRIASLFLWLPPQKTKFSPVIIKHPFTDCGMVVLRNSQQEPEPANILESESALNCWREEICAFESENAFAHAGIEEAGRGIRCFCSPLSFFAKRDKK